MKESETVEFKRSTGEIKEAVISIVAMLNKHGKGELYFGIRNDGEVMGQDVSDKTLRDISQAISGGIEPRIYPRIEKISIEGRECVRVVFEGDDMPYFAYGRAYKRVADEDRQISAKELESIIVKKNMESIRWDANICQTAKIEDVSVDRFRALTAHSKRINLESETKETILTKLHLLKDGKLTNAGVLLFAGEPNRFLENITVRCGRFRGVEKEEFLDMKDFNGNLFDNLENIIGFIKEHLKLRAEIKGMQRIESWEIPLEVLREAVINALIHRDYAKPGYIYVKIYDDTITISNPGELPEELAIEDLFREHESIPKNTLLADVFYYAGYIDTWGRGSLNIINKLNEAGIEKPIFEQSGGYFRITIKRGGVEEYPETREKTREKLLNAIMENPEITTRELASMLGITTKGVEWQLQQLKKKGIIKRVGPARGGHWLIKT